MFTEGPHGGKYSFNKHIFPSKLKIPLPGLGTLATLIRSQGGVTAQDLANIRYDALMKRLTTMARGIDKTVFVSGHEHSLQYIVDNGLPQIVSGSGAKKSATSLGKNGVFSYPNQGVAVLNVYKNGASDVKFYGNENGSPKLLFQTTIYKEENKEDFSGLLKSFDTKTSASIYKKDEIEKSKFHKWLWGDHHREIYGKEVNVSVATLDTLKGGLVIDRKGGGQQTRSLRLLDKEGKRYSLRAVRKSATQFLQKGAFKNTYLANTFDDTFTEKLLYDFYTSSHPYATFAVGKLADALQVYHANPELYFIPKHKALGQYNKDFGDELYILEERPGKEYKSLGSFGKPDDIESTDDVLKKLRKSELYRIDEENYILARLFDMILGDWDRHPDQWRWARFDTSKHKIYKPIPRDRDQVFSNYDGVVIDILKFVVPLARKFQVYDADLKKPRWMNQSGMPLDRVFTQNSGRTVWLAQAQKIKENLSDLVIENAFNNLPVELQGIKTEKIKSDLRSRRNRIDKIASHYYDYLSKLVVIKGTDKDDFFKIIREDDRTIVEVSRIKKKKPQQPFVRRTISSKDTKEVWIYGLDDNDQFEVKGKGKNLIKVRIIGGQNKDRYTVENGKKVKIYDHIAGSTDIVKNNKAHIVRSNSYFLNTYDFHKNINRSNMVMPSIGFNPDDGFHVDLTNVYTTNGFRGKTFQNKHIAKAAYFWATRGLDFSYNGVFANTFKNWDILIHGRYTSQNYAQNFFGFGNETKNGDNTFGLSYNRVKTSIWSAGMGLVKRGIYGSSIAAKGTLEGIEVQETPNRFITSLDFGNRISLDQSFFDRKFFANLDISYSYISHDNIANPTRGMEFYLRTGARMNIENSDRTYGYIHPRLVFYLAMTRNKKVVLKTDVRSKINIGDGFEFYQGVSLGGSNGLRGYREERFLGESALAFNGDIRYSFNTFKTGILPLQLGVFGGYDIGRVWLDIEESNIWHDSYGGGFWINAIDTISGQLGLFGSEEGARLVFAFGMGF